MSSGAPYTRARQIAPKRSAVMRGSASRPELIGRSPAMQEISAVIQRVAPAAFPVLIVGETGTGKELVAEAIHAASGRRVFIPVNCAAVPDTLLESEMFGHVRGAFTGADHDRAGLLEAADGGTLFLDEIGDLPLPLQPKLLRAIERGEVRRVGANEVRHVNVRLIAATNRNLLHEIEKGRFREDLFWRLKGIQIKVPPLRERPGDIAVLARAFLGQRTLSADAQTLVEQYAWPGNVRELRTALELAVTMADDSAIQPEHLPVEVRLGDRLDKERPDHVRTGFASIKEVVQQHIDFVMREVGEDRTRAARILGIDPKTLRRKLKAHTSLRTSPSAKTGR